MNFEAKRLGGLEVDHRTELMAQRQRIADYIFFSDILFGKEVGFDELVGETI